MKDKHTIRDWKKKFPTVNRCQRVGCELDADVAAHIHKAKLNATRLYVIGLCGGCNHLSSKFEIKDKTKLIVVRGVTEDIGKVVIIKGKKE